MKKEDKKFFDDLMEGVPNKERYTALFGAEKVLSFLKAERDKDTKRLETRYKARRKNETVVGKA